MGKQSTVPFGPQHPVLPEPVHLDLVMEDEKILKAIPSIGFVHRGLESLIEKKDYQEMVYVVERTCGICSFMHGMGYCEAVEHIMNLEVPKRARFLRTIWCEMSRIHSHLLWLGLLADAFGFESLFYQAWRMREKILDCFEMTTGGRVIFSVNTIGGVLKDMEPDHIKAILDAIEWIEGELKVIRRTFLFDATVETRLKGVGVLSKEEAHDLGCVGPFGRASGLKVDTRKRGYAAYPEIDFEPVTSTVGDSFARCDVRINEVFQSIDIIRQAVAKLPDEKDLNVPVKPVDTPLGEYFMRVEQPRGEACYYVKGNGTKLLDRLRIRTPTFANIPGMLKTLEGADYADVPILILTIDPCISCTER